MTDFSDITPDTWLEHFGSAYGRMCVLAAQAYHAQAGEYRIRMAMEGKGVDYYHHPASLDRIRVARRRLVTLQKQARVCGVSGAVQEHRRQEIREAIGQEWNAPIPDLGQST